MGSTLNYQELNIKKYINFLERNSNEKFANEIEILLRLEYSVNNYQNVSIDKRHSILEEIFQHYKDFVECSINETQKEWQELGINKLNIIHEDSFHKQIYLNDSNLKNSANILNQLIEHLKPLDYNYLLKEHVNYFFNENYNNQEQVGILEFYTKWKESKYLKQSIVADFQKAYYKELSKTIEGTINQEEVNIRLNDLPKWRNDNTQSTKNNVFSYGAYVQTDKEKTYVNGLHAGFGQPFAKYATQDIPLQDSINQWNKKALKNVALIECSDSIYNNICRHSPICENELIVPDSFSNSTKSFIKFDDLYLKYNVQTENVEMKNKVSGKTVHPLIMDMLSDNSRSDFINFIYAFGPSNRILYNSIIEVVDRKFIKKGKPNKIKVFPRIVIEDNLVIRRKTWRVPVLYIPRKKSNETINEYFLNLNLWRTRHDLPKEVFIKVAGKENIKKDQPKNVNNLKEHDYKPLYISFSNIFLVQLFEKEIRKSPGEITLTEVKPELTKENYNDGFVKEYVIQWYNFADEK